MRWVFVLCAVLTAGLAPPFFSALAADGLRHTAVNENFYGVEIVDHRAWIVGYYGAILHTADRGATWSIQPNPTRSALYRARFHNPNQGWIAGSYGTLLRTDDGGATWRVQPTATAEHLFGLTWLDEQSGLTVGSRGTILRTGDGGRTWANHSLPQDLTLNSIAFLDAKRGWIAAEFGAIFHTSDGGLSWRRQTSPIEVAVASGESQNLFALLFDRERTGWAFGLDGVILKSRDGARWEIIRRKQNAQGSFDANHLFAAATYNGRLWAAGERGTLLHAGADGNQWQRIKLDIPRVSLNAIAFGEKGFGLAVGNRGVVLRTDDGGATWQRIKIEISASGIDRKRRP
jgi:photosystem II stability/assembly factor-like uncharacterized protein